MKGIANNPVISGETLNTSPCFSFLRDTGSLHVDFSPWISLLMRIGPAETEFQVECQYGSEVWLPEAPYFEPKLPFLDFNDPAINSFLDRIEKRDVEASKSFPEYQLTFLRILSSAPEMHQLLDFRLLAVLIAEAVASGEVDMQELPAILRNDRKEILIRVAGCEETGQEALNILNKLQLSNLGLGNRMWCNDGNLAVIKRALKSKTSVMSLNRYPIITQSLLRLSLDAPELVSSQLMRTEIANNPNDIEETILTIRAVFDQAKRMKRAKIQKNQLTVKYVLGYAYGGYFVCREQGDDGNADLMIRLMESIGLNWPKDKDLLGEDGYRGLI